MSYPATPLLDLASGRRVSDDLRDSAGIVASAVEHRLGGLLFSAAQAGEAELGPQDLVSLAAADASTCAHHRRLWQALGSAVSMLAEAGIETAAMKGVTSEARWFGRMGERPCSDIDLVVRHDHIDRLPEILAILAADYPMIDEATELVRSRRLQHVHFEWQGATIDLHLDPLKLGMWTRGSDIVWSTTDQVANPEGGGMVRVFGPEVALVGALTHLNKDRFAYLGAYGEIIRIATDPTLDWGLVSRFVEGEGLAVPVWRSLAAVADALDVDLAVLETAGWKAMLWDRLWPPSSRLQGDEGRTTHRHRQLVIPVVADGRGSDAAREWTRRVLPPRELLDVNDEQRCTHSYLRRVTMDRMP
ncbi:MAG: nucleotidyltransferase family protein [Acidimicrobiales bacterium]